jgi:hypothetical protein
MIIHVGNDQFAQDAYVICIAEPVDLETLQRRARARPGSYVGDLIDSLFDSVFNRSLDLKRDYEVYFGAEYRTFQEYLTKRFRFSAAITERISAQFSESKQQIYLESGPYFLEDEHGQDFLEILFDAGEEE